ncbi:MAG: YihA family ribosome biogenesis GTP-binding protein [Saprospiraceae bacterium]|nr:YihA family ribosome biogenesis GTP-binding protein [Saprospiraceae bacterium]
MIIRTAEYIGSFPKFTSLPESSAPEFCFWGRSNVGKSSLINYLCNRKGLALTSSTPGKTVNFNLFQINNEFIIVDLPGYGYAQVSKKQRNFWNHEIDKYLKARKTLITVFLLVDISIDIQKTDLEKIQFLGEFQIPFVITFTKSDKIKKAELLHNIETYNAKLHESWENLPPQIMTTAIKNSGKEEILEYISSHLNAQSIKL